MLELQQKEGETQRNTLNLNSQQGRIEISKLYSLLLPPKIERNTRMSHAEEKKIPDAEEEHLAQL